MGSLATVLSLVEWFFFLTSRIDVNECSLGRHSCSADAICTNSDGSYLCDCKSGYSGNGFTCTDIFISTIIFNNNSLLYIIDVNECTQNMDNCSSNALCTNTQGSFLCDCNSGYNGNGVNCAGTSIKRRKTKVLPLT